MDIFKHGLIVWGIIPLLTGEAVTVDRTTDDVHININVLKYFSGFCSFFTYWWVLYYTQKEETKGHND